MPRATHATTAAAADLWNSRRVELECNETVIVYEFKDEGFTNQQLRLEVTIPVGGVSSRAFKDQRRATHRKARATYKARALAEAAAGAGEEAAGEEAGVAGASVPRAGGTRAEAAASDRWRDRRVESECNGFRTVYEYLDGDTGYSGHTDHRLRVEVENVDEHGDDSTELFKERRSAAVRLAREAETRRLQAVEAAPGTGEEEAPEEKAPKEPEAAVEGASLF